MFMMGLIHVGPDVGFGVYGALCPALSHVTQHHLQMLPAAVREEFPHAHSIALAGRLPGLMTAAGVWLMLSAEVRARLGVMRVMKN